MLLDALIRLLEASVAVLPQQRSRQRAFGLALAMLTGFGRRTLSRSICGVGRQHQDWSADYKVFSRSPWEPNALFEPVFDHYLDRYPDGPVSVALDATHLVKSGRRVPGSYYFRDPMSPPFHPNLVLALRFVQAALVFPHYTEGDYGARSYPVTFASAPVVKKPGKRGTEEAWAAYREAVKTNNLSYHGLTVMRDLRNRLDAAGASSRPLLISVDGSFCNQTVFRASWERTVIIARSRKDACLCFPAPSGQRRVYGKEKFTPDAVRQDDQIPWQTASVNYGGARREMRYKEVCGVLWQRGGGRNRLRLIVLAPVPYQNSPNGKRLYRQPAYLLVTETDLPVADLIQAYCDRWQIEVNHRDEKDILGVGEAQVWSRKSVYRQPAFAVAAYSMLMLAGLLAYGPGRTADYVPLPKWRKRARRASALDLLTKLRDEINERGGTTDILAQIKQNTPRYAYT